MLSRHSDVRAAVLDADRYSSAGGLTVRYDELAARGDRPGYAVIRGG